jgi:hypothetical protein
MRSSRLAAILAGTDGPGRRALPVGELLAPLPLAAIALLLVNDWALKPAAWAPRALTGKLSDVCGLFIAPLVGTALLDLVLFGAAHVGLPVDFSLRRGKLAAAALAVGALFAAAKLSPAAALALTRAAAALGLDWRIAPDATDLLALPALAAAVWVGRREIARVPLGRLEVLERARRREGLMPSGGLDDAIACGAEAGAVRALGAALDAHLAGGPAAPVWDALRSVRG